MKEITLTIEGYESGQIEDRVAQLLADRFEKDLSGKIADLVHAHVQTALQEVTTAALQAEVDKVIAEGWHKTGSYGERGPHVTFADRINEHLFGKADSYGSKTRLDKALEEALERGLHGTPNRAGFRSGGALQPIIDDAQKRFRELVDNTMTEKLQQTMREALGLKK
jgi:hypothetical protein